MIVGMSESEVRISKQKAKGFGEYGVAAAASHSLTHTYTHWR